MYALLVVGLVFVSVRTTDATSEESVDRNCAQELARVISENIADGPRPVCDTDGTYHDRQIYMHPMAGIRNVRCVTKGGKTILRGSEIQACKCPRERYEADERFAKRIVGGFRPSCNNNTGHYSPRQAHGGTGFQWCADEAGNVIGEKKRSTPVGC